MYIFSVNATAKKTVDDIPAGRQMPFIVYINFLDLFGAEHLCKLYLMRAGFTDIQILKRKLLPESMLNDAKGLAADKALADAVEGGYHIQVFEAH